MEERLQEQLPEANEMISSLKASINDCLLCKHSLLKTI